MTHRESTDTRTDIRSTRPATARRRLGTALAAAALLAAPALSPALLAVPAQAAGTSATAPATTTDAPAAAAAEQPILGIDSELRYLDNGTDPAAGASDRTVWTQPDFDDSAWASGTSGFGAKQGKAEGLGENFPVTTLLNQYKEGSTENKEAFFFRTDVKLNAAQAAAGLAGKALYDDSLTVYINGKRVKGFDDAQITQNLQYGGSGASDPRTAKFDIAAEQLVEGENTLAFEVHNQRADSSDVYFSLLSLATAAAAPEAAEAQDLVLQNGSTDSQRLLSWQTADPAELGVRWAKQTDLVDGKLPETAQTAQQTEQGEAVDGRHFHRATMDGLASDTQYSYQVGSDETGWSDIHSFDTAVTGDFNVYGDPQIGSSGDVDADAAGWKRTLQASLQTNPEAAFLYTLGDQVEHKDSQEEFAAYLAPEQSRTMAQATTLGNHEAGSSAYGDHFNRPNVSAEHGQNVKGTGGDYWFISNDVLFVNFNANASSAEDIAEHKDFLEQVVKEQGDKARWTAVVFHKAPYSTANHLDDDDVMRFRAAFPEAFSANDVDLVLGGHDHVYSRTHLLDGSGAPADEAADGESIADKRPNASAPVELDKDAGESLYYTLTSSSGSKFYDMYTDEQMDEAGFPKGNVAAAEQTRTPGYLNVKATCEELTLTTRSVDAAGADSVVETVKLGKDASECPGGEPSAEPSAEQPTTEPGETPGTQPGETPAPEQPTGEPGAGAGGDADGGTDGAGTDPGTDPADAPEAGSLPRTGVQIGTALGIAGLLVAGGGLALVLARKRRG